MRVETAIGQTFQRVELHRYCLRLRREACFARMLFLMSLTTFSSCVGVERVETVWVRLASEFDCTVTDCGSHVKRVLALY